MRRQVVPTLGALVLLSACGLDQDGSKPPLAPVAPQAEVSVSDPIASGQATCPEGLKAFSIDEPQTKASSSLADGTLSAQLAFTSGAKGQVLSWSSALGVDRVIVEGGETALVYTYATESTSGSGLHAPLTAHGHYADVSRITLCYDVEVLVSQRVEPSRSPHGHFNWHVKGTATLSNPTLGEAALTGVSAEISGGIAPRVTCSDAGAPVAMPYTLAPGASLECTYAAYLEDGTPRTVRVRVETPEGAPVAGNTHSASVAFSGAQTPSP
jgi:hypothetical protein